MRGVKVSIASFQSLKNEFKSSEKTLRKKSHCLLARKALGLLMSLDAE